MPFHFFAIEHSENRIITLFGLFENETGPGVLQLTLEKCMYSARNQRHNESAT